jgi:hypothetical protein
MAKDISAPDGAARNAVSAYKQILASVIDRRPSGTRQRLATALAKNRSFISQITSPSYHTPIPANHLEVIFEICHFSAEERRRFLESYSIAHPKRLSPPQDAHRLKAHTFYLPDLGDDAHNEALHALVSEFVRQIARLMQDKSKKETAR